MIRARDGKESLQLYDPAAVNLVLTDLIMPDMEGVELILALRGTQFRQWATARSKSRQILWG